MKDAKLMPRTDILKCPVCKRSYVTKRMYPVGAVCSRECAERKRGKQDDSLF